MLLELGPTKLSVSVIVRKLLFVNCFLLALVSFVSAALNAPAFED